MAEYLINDVSLFVSKALEATYNQDVTSATGYAKIRTLQAAYVLPQVEFINDAGVPGNGHEFATTWCPATSATRRSPSPMTSTSGSRVGSHYVHWAAQ